jgi:hypothetical protein
MTLYFILNVRTKVLDVLDVDIRFGVTTLLLTVSCG